jgi:hypothetical protein
VFNFFNSIKEVHHCKQSDLRLLQSSKFGASLTMGEDDGINRLPNGFRCQLPDQSVWQVKASEWLKLSVPLTEKQGHSKAKGGAQW